jgi:hypothetical protein
MAYTTIDNGEEHFNTILYTGDGSADNDITGVGFAPDWVWAKNRGAADANWILDSTRGATKGLYTNGNAAENTQNHLISFDSDGFSVGNQANGLNTSSNNYVAWNWKANGGTTSSNSDGDITATVQANTTAGFSIMTWTSNNADNQTIGHGLGAAPEVFWVKIRNATGSWYCYFKEAGATHYLSLNSTGARVDNVIWGDTHPTSSVITVDTNSLSGSTPTVVSYAFKQIQGYSKFGSYTGNGNADGPFVFTGFKPAWLLIKSSGSSGDNWVICDNKRDTFNVMENILLANSSNAEFDETSFDFLSNGFKLRQNAATYNDSGDTFVYMAFAEHPFVSSKGVPVTAR